MVTLKNSTVLQESGQVIAAAKKHRNVSNDPSQASIDAVCEIAKEAKKSYPLRQTIKLAGGVTLEAPKSGITPDKDFFKGSSCVGKSTIAVKNAQVNYPGATFTGVQAEITAAGGLKLAGADWKLPANLSTGTISSISLTAGETPPIARLVDGDWELIEGEFSVVPIKVGGKTFDGIPWIPLAEGWQFAEGKTLISFLNSSEDHPEIKDNTLQFSEEVTGPEDLSIRLNANSSDSKWDLLSVTASNIGLGETATGDTLMGSGTGQLALGQKGSQLDIEVQCVKDGQPVATCELFSGLTVKDFVITLSRERVGLKAEGGIVYGTPASTFEFGLVGAYSSRKNWSMAAKSTAAWDLVDGMQLTNLGGNIANTPIKDKPGQSQLTAGLTGSLTGLQVSKSVKVVSLSPSITNACPPDTEECNTGQVRFSIDAVVQAALPGGKTAKLTAGALLNLATFEFEFDFGSTGMEIGPKELQVTDTQFVLANTTKTGACTPHGTQLSVNDPGLRLGFQAQATLLEAQVTVGGSFDSNGYCLWGRPGPMDVGPAMDARAGVLSFTDYPNGADLKLPNQPDILVGANKIRVNGEFDLPSSIDQRFGIPEGGLEYEATYDFQQKGVHFALSYTPKGTITIYQGNGSNLTLTKVAFEVSYSSAAKEADLDLAAYGNLFVAGGGGTPDSNTPMGVSIGFEIGAEGVKATLTAALESGGKPIENAFGQADLIVTKLAVSLGFTLPAAAPELSFNASVQLPDRWVGNIGIKKGARIAMAFRLAAEKPCLKIEIGEENVENRSTVVDIANKGFLTAQYFKILIAPAGCQVPVSATETEAIAPGMGFEFDGAIASAPITVVINSSFNDGLVLKGKLTVPALDLTVVKLQGSQPGIGARLDLDIDSKAGRYNVDFDAGIAIGVPERGIGAAVVVTGSLNTSDENFVALSLNGRSSIKLGVAGMDINPMRVALRVPKPGKSTDYFYADIEAKMVVSVLGFGMEAGGQLTYNEGQLERLRIYVGKDLDIKIAEVKGTAEFNYCLGTLSELGQNGSTCTVFAKTYQATPAYRVGFYGFFRFAWWTKQYVWQVYDQRGTEGTDKPKPPPPPEPELDPQYVPGSIPSVNPHTMEAQMFTRYGIHDLQYTNVPEGNDQWNVYIKTAYPLAYQGIKACERARLGSEWKPTGDNPNPPVVNTNPDPSGDPCALVVDVMSESRYTPGSVARIPVVCTATSCVAKGNATWVTLNGKVLALNGPNGAQAKEGRDALLAGLRTPPGSQPQGAYVISANGIDTPYVLSPDGEYQMWFPNWAVLFQRRGNSRYAYEHYWNTKAGTNFAVTNTGRIGAYDEKGNLLESFGTKAPLPTDQYPVYLFVQDGFQVVQEQPSGPPVGVWGVKSDGSCFPNKDSCS
jgi:hypothetical protein